MPVTMKAVRAVLDPEEPDYAKAAQLGPEALPLLRELILGPDQMMASKAASAAAAIGGAGAADVLAEGVRSPNAAVRVSAVAAAGMMGGPEAEALLLNSLGDGDSGVRRQVLRAVAARPSAAVAARLREVGRTDQEAGVRAEARRLATQAAKVSPT
jgi:HEAT repeat protein